MLGALLSVDEAMSHHEVITCLKPLGDYDRVTVYRVLDWLIAHGLVHKVAGAGRAWKFQANRGGESAHAHAHFQCTRCGRVSCLPDVHPPLPVAIPAGYRAESIELTIRGTCSDCARAPAR